MPGRILHVQVCVEKRTSESEHSLAVSNLSSCEVPVVHLRYIRSQLLESLSLLHPEIVVENTESCAEFAAVRVVEPAVLVGEHG